MMKLEETFDKYLTLEERDAYWLKIAKAISVRSPDPSTKVGAIIVDDAKNEIVRVGWNKFPTGLDLDPTLYDNRDEKLKRVVHAEMMAIIGSTIGFHYGHTLYTWPCMPCSDCMKHIYEAGINKCVFPKAPEGMATRWKASFDTTLSFLNQYGRYREHQGNI